MVILRSTTGPYGRSIIEVAYGEILISLYRGCMGGDAREEWLGYRHVVAHVGHTRVNTSVGSMHSIFLSFHTIKLYVLCIFQIYIYIIK